MHRYKVIDTTHSGHDITTVVRKLVLEPALVMLKIVTSAEVSLYLPYNSRSLAQGIGMFSRHKTSWSCQIWCWLFRKPCPKKRQSLIQATSYNSKAVSVNFRRRCWPVIWGFFCFFEFISQLDKAEFFARQSRRANQCIERLIYKQKEIFKSETVQVQ